MSSDSVYHMAHGERVSEIYRGEMQGFDIDFVEFPPGVETPVKYHTLFEEHFIVVSGVGHVWIGNDWVEIHKGDSFIIKREVDHRFRTGLDRLAVVIVCIPKYIKSDENKRNQ